jgi:hemerythrin-like domain-containing protein
MADVFEVLSADHAGVKSMLSALEESPGPADGATEAVLAARLEVTRQLIIDESQHEAAEEQYFWPAVRSRLANGSELADEAVSQESEAKQVLARLDKLKVDDEEFERLITAFIPAARKHIEFEETRVWPALRESLSAAEAQDLGGKIQKAEDHGPTRPHPHTPPSPAVLKTAGPAVAALDKLRDAVTGRGRPD